MNRPPTEASATPEPRPRVGILLGDRGNSFWSAMETEYRRAAPACGMDVECIYAEPEKDLEAQLAAMLSMIARAFDAIVVNPLDQRNLVPGILTAAAGGIPVIDVGAKTDGAAVREAGDWYHPVLTVDFWEQGRLAGRFLAERLQAGSEPVEVLIVEGRLHSKQSIGRTGGAIEVLAGCPGVQVAAGITGNFDRESARRAAEAALQAHPRAGAFICANDLMALGVADALDDFFAAAAATAGHLVGTRPLVVGVDGTREAREAVAAGRITATVAFSPADVAEVILQAVDEALQGRRPPRGHTVASRLYTRDDAALERLAEAVVQMDTEGAAAAAQAALDMGIDAYAAIEGGLMAGMERVGRLYETYEYFVPELLLAGDAMNAALDILKPHLAKGTAGRGVVVLGVVQGDIHDIGKNLVRAMLEAAGFEVIDLGKDVPPERFIQAAEEHGAKIIALSALMTSTVSGMKDVVDLLESAGRHGDIRVVVGGAPLSQAFATSIGADAYSPTAVTAVEDLTHLINDWSGDTGNRTGKG